MKARIDIVTVYHNDANYQLHLDLRDAIAKHEPQGGYRFIGIDNRTRNRGFAAGCNLGALHAEANAPIIGFLNPDTVVHGPFFDAVEQALSDPLIAITGCRFGKPQHDLDIWGVPDWVCGAAMFIKRRWYENVGGFDEQFTWAWEETDLIRQALAAGLKCKSIKLPITHESPLSNTDAEASYKRFHFSQGQKRFAKKWGRTNP